MDGVNAHGHHGELLECVEVIRRGGPLRVLEGILGGLLDLGVGACATEL